MVRRRTHCDYGAAAEPVLWRLPGDEVRATFSRLDKPRLEFELRSASCRPPPRLQRHTPHSNWSDDTEIVFSSKWLNSHLVDYQSSNPAIAVVPKLCYLCDARKPLPGPAWL